MKALLLGMDGVTDETFRRGWTPFILSLIEQGHALTLHEDLLSRGWSEIATGRHAIDTGALYERPLMGQTYGWTESYKLADVPGLGQEVKPLWQVLNERGWRVGIMNVPTTYPAPEVDGFFVSGGGGGGPVDQNVVAEQCYPRRIQQQLAQQGYIVDERFGSLLGEKGLYEPEDFFGRLNEMNERRTSAFIELAKQECIDFGFLVYKSSTVGTESLITPELDKRERDLSFSEEILDAARDFYRDLDSHIQRLVEAFPSVRVILVSDHSTVSRKAAVNLNAFLVESGLQFPSVARRGVYDFIKSFKHLVPHALRQKLKQNKAIRQSYESIVTFDPARTQAFCMAFSNGAHGIYINDAVRFSGPVKTENVEAVAEEIVQQFNKHPLARRYGFVARRKWSNSSTRPVQQFPDIVVTLPDGYQTSNRYQDFVRICELPATPLTLREAERDLRLSGKGHCPLAVSVGAPWQLTADSESLDLTVIYEQVLAEFVR